MVIYGNFTKSVLLAGQQPLYKRGTSQEPPAKNTISVVGFGVVIANMHFLLLFFLLLLLIALNITARNKHKHILTLTHTYTHTNLYEIYFI